MRAPLIKTGCDKTGRDKTGRDLRRTLGHMPLGTIAFCTGESLAFGDQLMRARAVAYAVAVQMIDTSVDTVLLITLPATKIAVSPSCCD